MLNKYVKCNFGGQRCGTSTIVDVRRLKFNAVKFFQLDTTDKAECVVYDEHGSIVSLQAQLPGRRKVTKIFCTFTYKTNVHVTSLRAYLSVIKQKTDFTQAYLIVKVLSYMKQTPFLHTKAAVLQDICTTFLHGSVILNCMSLMGPVAQSVQRLSAGWTVRGSNPGGGEIFLICPDRPWDPPSLLYNGYRVFHGGKKRPGRDADPSPPSSAVVMKGQSYTSTPLVGRTACTEPHCVYNGAHYLTIFPKCNLPIKVN